MRKNWLLVVTACVALAAGLAWAQGPGKEPGPPGMGPGFGMRGGMGHGPMDETAIREELGLTEEQATKLRAWRYQAMRSGLRAHADVLQRRLELQELLENETPDKAALDRAIRALSDAQGAALRQRVENRLAVRQVLTPEQRGKIRQFLRQRMRQRMMLRRGDGPRLRGPEGGFGRGGDFGPVRGPGFDEDLDLDFDIEIEPPNID